MNNQKDDAFYLQKILTDLDFIIEHMNGVKVLDLSSNELLLDSMLFRLVQIQENASKLTDAFKMEHYDIPWKNISGLRNRIVHDYGNVDLDVVFDALTVDIPKLKAQLS